MRRASSSVVIKKVRVPLMIDSTDEKVIDDGAHVLPGQGDHQLDQPRGRRGALREGGAAGARSSARRWWSAASTRHRAWRVTRAAQARDRRALATSCSPRSTGCSREDIYFDPLVFPCASGDEQYVGSGGRDDRGRARSSSSASRSARRCSASPTCRFGLPDGRPRGAELRVPLPLRAGRAGPGARQLREARALPVDPRGGAQALPRTCSTTAATDPIDALRRALPRAQAATKAAASTLPLDERLRALHHRGHAATG